MKNTSLWDDVLANVTVSSTPLDDDNDDNDVSQYVAHIRHVAVKIIYILIGTIGITDNLFVIIIFFLFISITDKTMNILIVHQSIIDMCASFFTLMLAVVEVDGTHMSPDCIYDQFVCHIWLTRQPLWYFLTISTCGILLISLDRYVSVIHPVWQNNHVNAKTRLIYGGMVFSWIFLPLYLTLAGSLGTYIINGVCEPWGRYSTYAAQVTMNVSMISITYLIPLMMMAFFYTRIVCALRSKSNPVSSMVVNAAGRNALITSLLVCCGFVVCWTPCQMITFIGFVSQSVDFTGSVYQFSVVLMEVNSCINGFIYAAKYREFQKGVRRLATELRKRLHQEQAEVFVQVSPAETEGTGGTLMHNTNL